MFIPNFIASTILLQFYISAAEAEQLLPRLDRYVHYGYGRLSYPNCVLLNTTATSYPNCLLRCHLRPSCYGVTYNSISQSCQLISVSFDGIDPTGLLTNENDYLTVVRQMKSLVVPYTYPLAGGFPVGSVLTVKGTPLLSAVRIQIQLWDSRSGNIPFYINPRFDSYTGGLPNYVAVNNGNQTGWGPELAFARLPYFDYGVEFEVTVKCNTDAYNVYVNGVSYANLTHRMDSNISNRVLIQNDLVLSFVSVTYP